jgi:AcrR family transcriptional regulator
MVGPDAYDVSVAIERDIVPRGRHAPPLEVRLDVQRRRLFAAAAAVFTRSGYAEASAEGISREAGMSKATFYEHFANKEECLLAMFDAGVEDVMREMAAASDGLEVDSYEERVRAVNRAFLGALGVHPESTYTLIVTILGAGPRAATRRGEVLEAFAEALHQANARHAPAFGAPTFASRDDAYAVVGAAVELVARHLRREDGNADLLELEPVISRLVLGALDRAVGG